MDGGKGRGEIMPQREAPAEMEIVELKSASQVREAADAIGGQNILKEHGMLDGSPSEKGKWLEDVQSAFIDDGGAALAVKEGGKFVGFVLADQEGVITRFQCAEGKDVEVIERAVRKLKDKGMEHISVRLTEQSERARKAFLTADFVEKERAEDGKIVMEKE